MYTNLHFSELSDAVERADNKFVEADAVSVL
jgi:hypothetical protein